MSDNKKDSSDKIIDHMINDYKEGYMCVDPNKFITPTMGDYEIYNMSYETANNLSKENVEDSNVGAEFFLEAPFSETPGYYEKESAFVITGKPINLKYAKEVNNIDGDTIYLDHDSIIDGNQSFEIAGRPYKNFKDYAKINALTENFGIRLLGGDAPEIPHYSLYPSDGTEHVKTISVSDIKKNMSGYIVDKHSLENLEKVKFIKDKNKDIYTQIVEENIKVSADMKKYFSKDLLDAKYIHKVVASDSTDINNKNLYEDGIKARDTMLDILSSAKKLTFVLSSKIHNMSSSSQSLNDTIKDYLLRPWAISYDSYGKGGYNAPGLDNYKRFLGNAYAFVELPGFSEPVWINILKYIMTQIDTISEKPLFDRNDILADEIQDSAAFKLWTYDKNGKIVADALDKLSAESLDDRKRMQEAIMNNKFETLVDYNVMIGDNMFFVPPTSIRCTTSSLTTRVPVLRAKGSLVKSAGKNNRQLELTLYFNEDRGINGYPYQTTLPNGESITYYMNGLRSLIAMFKFAPFQPIENEYINRVLGIEAVTLTNIQISTVQNYPGTIGAVLSLQEFDYRTYMPQIVPDLNEDFTKEYSNSFSKTINFPLLRWFYQRSVIKGNELKASYPFGSEEYIKETFGSRTSLQPFNIGNDSSIKFYIIDKDYLDEKLQIKLDKLNSYTPVSVPLTDTSKKFAQKLGILFNNFSIANQDSNVKLKLKEIASAGHFSKDNAVRDYAESLNTYLLKTQESQLLRSISGKTNSINTKGYIHINIDTNLISNENDLDNLFKLIKVDEDLISSSKKMLQSGEIEISIDLDKGEIDTSCEGYKLLKAFSKMGPTSNDELDKESEELDNDSMSNADDIKENTDIETIKSLRFIEYPTGNITINNVSAVFGNTFTKLSLQSSESYAPQYCGGQDTLVEIALQTTDSSAAALIQNLPRIAASYVKDYKLVLQCFPIRIDSEITRLLGINEILIENLQVDTVPNQPGLYNIILTLVSVDRTTRNMESLKKIDTNNSGSISSANKGTFNERSYFDLDNALKQAETYPDLELPTLLELSKVGYEFIRYSNSNRVYPDPDFYFVYNDILFNEALRDSIVDSLNEQSPYLQKISLEDSYGSLVKLRPEKEVGFEVEESNDIDQAINENKSNIIKNFPPSPKNFDTLYIKKDQYSYEDILGVIANLNVYDGWDISDEVKCLFRENEYEPQVRDGNGYYAEQIRLRGDEVILAIDKILDSKIDSGNSYKDIPLSADSHMWIEREIEKGCKKFFTDEGGKNLLKVLEINDENKFIKNMQKVCCAVASGITSTAEYSNQYFSNAWKPMMVIEQNKKFVPICQVRNIKTQDLTSSFQAANLEDAISNGISFGMYNIKLYRKEELINILQDKNAGQGLNENDEINKVNGTDRFLDKYYREKCSYEEYEEYKKGILIDPAFSTIAFLRNTLESFKVLIKNNIIMSLFEIIDDELLNLLSNKKTTEKYMAMAESYLTPSQKAIINKSTYNSETSINDKKIVDTLKVQKQRYEELCKKMKLEEKNYYTYRTDSNISAILRLTPEEEKEFMTLYNKRNEFKDIGEDLTKKAEEEEKKKQQEWEEYYKKATPEEKKELDKIKKDTEDSYKNKEKEAKDMIETMKKTIKENKDSFDIGKFIPSILLVATNFNETLDALIKNKATNELNSLTNAAVQGDVDILSDLDDTKIFKKILLAMVGYKLIKSETKIGQKGEYASSVFENIINENIYIECADDPYIYIMHSFYDMVMHDKRGRMARAFPTFYMLFIDEGRDIGLWHLQDNFYNINSISDIEITKSRKIAADTAKITMSNMFDTFSTEDEDKKLYNDYSLYDAWNSIFSPRKVFEKEQFKRTNMRSVEKAKITPGTRIHIRMGYDADASKLPIVFNGCITEVGVEDIVELVAQGDGVELVNPILLDTDAEDMQYEDEFVFMKAAKSYSTNGATPRTILNSLLSYKGSWTEKTINKFTSGRFFNRNPFGLVHFGDTDYKEIFKNGETAQNIYEATSTSPWNAVTKLPLAEEYSSDKAPKISTNLFGKSMWDIMHLCASASPDYICSVVPFGLRSSIFYGHPRYYYAYEYEKDSNNVVKEKRKPFQQYHIYTSYTDIIDNKIKASEKEMKTCAIGLYQSKHSILGQDKTNKVGPLWVK